MNFYQQYLRIKRLLPSYTKWRVAHLVPSFRQRIQWLHTPFAVYQAAAVEINLRFKAVSSEERDVLVFCLISEAVKTGAVAPIAGKGTVNNELDDLSMMPILKMQLLMDRMMKADSAASNSLKKFSDIADQIISNTK